MALNAFCDGVGRRNRLFLYMWNRICIFIRTVIFSPGVYIFHSGVAQKLCFKIAK